MPIEGHEGSRVDHESGLGGGELRSEDVDHLLAVFDRRTDACATLAVIEHNQRVIAHAEPRV